MSNTRRLAIMDGLAILTLVAVALFLPQPGESAFWKTAFDAGHAPLFGLIAILLRRRFAARTADRAAGDTRPYGSALLAALLLGVGLESAQILRPRDADLVDLLRNAAGICAGLALVLAIDATPHPLNRSRRRRLSLLIAAGVMLAAVAFPVVTLGVAMRQRDAALPILCDFNAGWSRRFWKVQNATLRITAPPRSWTGGNDGAHMSGSSVARLDFQVATYPGFSIVEPAGDWSQYENLRFGIYSELDSSVTLILRIDDAHAYHRYEDRFQGVVNIRPGANQVRVVLANVRTGPQKRELDLSRVRRVTLFAHRPRHPFSLYIRGFRLE